MKDFVHMMDKALGGNFTCTVQGNAFSHSDEHLLNYLPSEMYPSLFLKLHHAIYESEKKNVIAFLSEAVI